MTGLGPVPVRAPRVRDRAGAGEGRIRFTSAILPPYARRSKSLEVLIPILYLKGISSGDFEDALAALLGPDAGGLSAVEHRPAQGRLVGRACPVVQARSLGQTLRLFLGRRHPRAGPPRRGRPMPSRDHRRDAGRQEGACRPDRWRARERAVLEGVAARPQAARAFHRARACGRRRRTRLLASPGGGLAQDARPALLGAQDRQRPEQAAEEPASESQTRAPGDLDGRDQDRRRWSPSTPLSRPTGSSTTRRSRAW